MIMARFDFTEGWTVDGDAADTFAVCFSNGDSDRIHPSGLTFGWTITINGVTTAAHEWPSSNAVVREVTRQRTFEFRIGARADDEVLLAVWATESGRRVEDEISFVVPRPQQPFLSWVWDEGGWMPPVPHPNEDSMYAWDEDFQSWVSVP